MVVVVSMDKKRLGFAEIQELTGLPAQTLRRYAKEFSRWLPTRKAGRMVQFQPDAVETIEAIRAAFEQGMTTSQVKELVGASVAPTIDVGHVAEAETPLLPQSSAELPALLALGDRFVSVLERAVVALEAIAARTALQPPETGARVKVHDEAQTSNVGQSGASFLTRTREEIVGEVARLHKDGLGACAIATAMRRAGWPTLSGRGQWAKGSAARILKMDAVSSHGK